MPFCAGCGRKLNDGELCDCVEAKKLRGMNEPSEEFFDSVGKAIDEAETQPLSGDEDIKLRQPEKKLAPAVKRKIDDANRFAETRRFSLDGPPDEEAAEEAMAAGGGKTVNWKKMTVFSVGVIILTALLVLLFYGLSHREEKPLAIGIYLQNDCDLVISSVGGKKKSVVIPGEAPFQESKAFVTAEKDRAFFFAFDGKTLCYIDLTGKDWTKNEVLIIDEGFAVQRYWVSPDGGRLIYQKEENGPLYGVDLKKKERVQLSEKAYGIIIDEAFTRLYFAQGGSDDGKTQQWIYEVDLTEGWLTELVSGSGDEMTGQAPFFGDETGIYYLNGSALYYKPAEGAAVMVADNISFLAFRDPQGEARYWQKGQQICGLAEQALPEDFDGVFYYAASEEKVFLLSDFLLEESESEVSEEEQEDGILDISDIQGIKWSLEDGSRYLIVTSVGSSEVTLQYAYYNDAEGRYAVTEQKGRFSTPETIEFTVSEEEGLKNYTYQMYLKASQGKVSLLLNGEVDSMVLTGEYFTDDLEKTDPSPSGSWKNSLREEAGKTEYTLQTQQLYCYNGQKSILVKDGFYQGQYYQDGAFAFCRRDLSNMEKIDLSSMEQQITLSQLTALVDGLFAGDGEREYWVALEGQAFAISEEQYKNGVFSYQNGKLFCFLGEGTGELYQASFQNGGLGEFQLLGRNLSREWYRISGGEFLAFQDCKGELGSLCRNGAKIADQVYLSSCVLVSEGDLSRFFYQRYTQSGRELWFYNNGTGTLIGSGLSGDPVYSGERALYLQNLRSGQGDMVYYDGETSVIADKASLVLALQ